MLSLLSDPCKCPTAEMALTCMRAGAPMVGSLWFICSAQIVTEDEAARFRQAWDTVHTAPVPVQPTGTEKLRTCEHAGRAIHSQTRTCQTCCGPPKLLQVFACAVKPEGTIAGECWYCQEYRSK